MLDACRKGQRIIQCRVIYRPSQTYFQANTRQSAHSSSQSGKKGRFEAACGCLSHDIFAERAEQTLLKVDDSIKGLNSFKILIDRELITDRKKHICKACLNRYSLSSSDFRADSNANSFNEKKENSILKAVNKVTNHLKSLTWNNLSRDLKNNITQLAGELGRLINNDIFEDGQSNVASEYKDLDQLENMKPLKWIQERNILLQSFVENCTGVKLKREINSKKINPLAHSIEQIYYTANLNLITPFAFKQNLQSWAKYLEQNREIQ